MKPIEFEERRGKCLTDEGRRRIIAAQHRRKGQSWNRRTQEQRFAASERAFTRLIKERNQQEREPYAFG